MHILFYFSVDYDFFLKSNQVRLSNSNDPEKVRFKFQVENGNKSLNLRLVPTPSSLHALPSGEGVFFKNVLEVILLQQLDSDGKPIRTNFLIILR